MYPQVLGAHACILRCWAHMYVSSGVGHTCMYPQVLGEGLQHLQRGGSSGPMAQQQQQVLEAGVPECVKLEEEVQRPSKRQHCGSHDQQPQQVSPKGQDQPMVPLTCLMQVGWGTGRRGGGARPADAPGLPDAGGVGWGGGWFIGTRGLPDA